MHRSAKRTRDQHRRDDALARDNMCSVQWSPCAAQIDQCESVARRRSGGGERGGCLRSSRQRRSQAPREQTGKPTRAPVRTS